jgi:hypothetical protein
MDTFGDKVKDTIQQKIPTFERFKEIAQVELQNLPKDKRAPIAEYIANPESGDIYMDLRVAYEDAITERRVSSPEELASDATIEEFSRMLTSRGFSLDYQSEPGRKKLKIKISSDFLQALATFISKISGYL